MARKFFRSVVFRKNQKRIFLRIHSEISAADVILADLTRKNANVFYEVGICHALGKPVLLLAQSIDDVPFDLRHRRVLLYDYSPRGCKRLEGTLKDNMIAVLREL